MKQLVTIRLKRDNNDKYSFDAIEYQPIIQRAQGEKDVIYPISENESILTIETDFNTGDLDWRDKLALNTKRKQDIAGAKLKLIDYAKQKLFTRETNLNMLKQTILEERD